MKITLIYPRMNTSTQCPLGILWIAAILEKAGYDVQVIDPFPKNNWFMKRIIEFKPDVVGLSILTPEYPRASELMKVFKQKLPDAIFCAGGIHPTALAKETLNDLGLDFVVVGEGEYTMLEACKRIEAGLTLDGVRGIVYRDGDVVKINSARPLIENLDELPFPARHLLDMEWYLTPPGLVRGVFLKRTLGILASRGCPYNCIFCGSNSIFGRMVRRRSIENVINEIEHLIKQYDIDGFYFLDDTFTLDSDYVVNFCDTLRERKINLRWGCQVRVNTISLQLLKAMKEAGCIQVDVGAESGSDKVLRNLKKGITHEMTKNAFDLIHQTGMRGLATFIVGNPGETIEDIEKTRQLAHAISPDYVKFFYLVPFPGSELYSMARENSWIDREMEFSPQWQVRQTDDPLMTITFSKEQLRRIRAQLQNEFLLRNYLYNLREWRFALLMIMVLLRHPLQFIQVLVRIIHTKRIETVIEFALELYRIDKGKKIEGGK